VPGSGGALSAPMYPIYRRMHYYLRMWADRTKSALTWRRSKRRQSITLVSGRLLEWQVLPHIEGKGGGHATKQFFRQVSLVVGLRKGCPR
jgi:hypothetical protein